MMNGNPDTPASGDRDPLPVYDRAGFLARIMGDEELAREIEETFLEDLPLQIGRLEAASAAGNWDGVRDRAHQIKGAAASLGAGALRAAAARLEEAAGTIDRVEIDGLVSGVRRRYGEVEKAITSGRADG